MPVTELRISQLNSGVNFPGTDGGYTIPTGALFPFTDPTDTQQSPSGTTKVAPLLKVLNRTSFLGGDFDPAAGSPSISNAAGSSGNLYFVNNTGIFDLGGGDEYFVSGDLVFHDGTSFKKYRRNAFKKTGEISPQDFEGVVGVLGTGNDTDLIQAALRSPFSRVYIPSGIYIIDNVELSATGKRVYGEGDLRLIDNATTASGKGMFLCSGSGNTIEGLIFRGNNKSPPSFGEYGQPLRITGNKNLITNCKFYDSSTTVGGDDHNIAVMGVDNIVRDCESYNSDNSLYFNGNDNNKFYNIFGRRGTNTTKGFNSTGGSAINATLVVVDGCDLDHILQCDWVSENNPAMVERLMLSNCYVKTNKAGFNACKIAHARYVTVDNCHFEHTNAGFGFNVAERVHDVLINNTFIKGHANQHIISTSAGNKHHTICNLIINNCILGGTKATPSGNIDILAVDVRAFKFVCINSIINRFSSSAFKVHPDSSTGVIGTGVNTPPTVENNGNVYIVGDSPNGAFAGHNRELAWDHPDIDWSFEFPEYDTRVFDTVTQDWVMFDGSGWVKVPNEMYGYDIHDNQLIGFRDVNELKAVTSSPSAVPEFNKLLRRSDRIRFFNNELVNFGVGGTRLTTSILLEPIYQQKGPGRWWTDNGIPTEGTWFQGDWIDNIAVTGPGDPPGYVCIQSGEPGVFLFATLPGLSGGGS